MNGWCVSAARQAPAAVGGAERREDAGPSWQSRGLITVLGLLRVKRGLGSAQAVQAAVHRRAARPAAHAPAGLGCGVEVTRTRVAGWPVYHTAPSADPDVRNHVLFLHGGVYIHGMTRADWRFVGHLTREAGVHCIVPLHPPAPRGTAAEVVPAMGELLRNVLQDAGTAKVTVIGHSTGAGLALAAAQWLRDCGPRQPRSLILLCPGVNASADRPEQQALAARDPVLDIPGLVEAGRLYAGGLEVTHPYVSPVNGRFQGLAPLTVFSGTLDLLHPDSIELGARARAAGVRVALHVGEGQPHGYVTMPTPEGRRARAIILQTIRG